MAYLQSYQVIYDVRLEEQVSYGPALVVGALLVIAGVSYVVGTLLFARDRAGLRAPRWMAVAIVIVSLLSTYENRIRMKGDAEFRRRLDAGEYVAVEGVVTRRVPGDRGGHRDEVWIVESGGRRFRYAFRSSIESRGYRDIFGPVKQGSRVRIVDVDGRIARLEMVKWSFQ